MIIIVTDHNCRHHSRERWQPATRTSSSVSRCSSLPSLSNMPSLFRWVLLSLHCHACFIIIWIALKYAFPISMSSLLIFIIVSYLYENWHHYNLHRSQICLPYFGQFSSHSHGCYHANDKVQVYMGTGCPEEANVGRSVTMQSISSSLRSVSSSLGSISSSIWSISSQYSIILIYIHITLIYRSISPWWLIFSRVNITSSNDHK